MKVHILNISENIAEKIYISGFAIIDETGAALWRHDEVIFVDFLVGDCGYEIKFENPPVESNKHQVIFDMKYSDKFGTEYSCKAVGSFGERINLPSFKLTEL